MVLPTTTIAQTDSLFFYFQGKAWSEEINYPPKPDSVYFTWTGTYALENSPVAVTIPFKRGKESGVYRAFYPNGRLMIFAVYGWGGLHGDWTEYDELGAIQVKGQFRDGLRDGPWIFKKEGIRGKYKKGQKNGKWKYYEQGVLTKIEKYRKGSLRTGGTFQLKNR